MRKRQSLSLAPSFSTGTLGLKPSDAGVGSATLNTSQQVGGSIGTALLNTLAAALPPHTWRAG